MFFEKFAEAATASSVLERVVAPLNQEADDRIKAEGHVVRQSLEADPMVLVNPQFQQAAAGNEPTAAKYLTHRLFHVVGLATTLPIGDDGDPVVDFVEPEDDKARKDGSPTAAAPNGKESDKDANKGADKDAQGKGMLAAGAFDVAGGSPFAGDDGPTGGRQEVCFAALQLLRSCGQVASKAFFAATPTPNTPKRLAAQGGCDACRTVAQRLAAICRGCCPEASRLALLATHSGGHLPPSHLDSEALAAAVAAMPPPAVHNAASEADRAVVAGLGRRVLVPLHACRVLMEMLDAVPAYRLDAALPDECAATLADATVAALGVCKGSDELFASCTQRTPRLTSLVTKAFAAQCLPSSATEEAAELPTCADDAAEEVEGHGLPCVDTAQHNTAESVRSVPVAAAHVGAGAAVDSPAALRWRHAKVAAAVGCVTQMLADAPPGSLRGDALAPLVEFLLSPPFLRAATAIFEFPATEPTSAEVEADSALAEQVTSTAEWRAALAVGYDSLLTHPQWAQHCRHRAAPLAAAFVKATAAPGFSACIATAGPRRPGRSPPRYRREDQLRCVAAMAIPARALLCRLAPPPSLDADQRAVMEPQQLKVAVARSRGGDVDGGTLRDAAGILALLPSPESLAATAEALRRDGAVCTLHGAVGTTLDAIAAALAALPSAAQTNSLGEPATPRGVAEEAVFSATALAAAGALYIDRLGLPALAVELAGAHVADADAVTQQRRVAAQCATFPAGPSAVRTYRRDHSFYDGPPQGAPGDDTNRTLSAFEAAQRAALLGAGDAAEDAPSPAAVAGINATAPAAPAPAPLLTASLAAWRDVVGAAGEGLRRPDAASVMQAHTRPVGLHLAAVCYDTVVALLMPGPGMWAMAADRAPLVAFTAWAAGAARVLEAEGLLNGEATTDLAACAPPPALAESMTVEQRHVSSVLRLYTKVRSGLRSESEAPNPVCVLRLPTAAKAPQAPKESSPTSKAPSPKDEPKPARHVAGPKTKPAMVHTGGGEVHCERSTSPEVVIVSSPTSRFKKRFTPPTLAIPVTCTTAVCRAVEPEPQVSSPAARGAPDLFATPSTNSPPPDFAPPPALEPSRAAAPDDDVGSTAVATAATPVRPHTSHGVSGHAHFSTPAQPSRPHSCSPYNTAAAGARPSPRGFADRPSPRSGGAPTPWSDDEMAKAEGYLQRALQSSKAPVPSGVYSGMNPPFNHGRVPFRLRYNGNKQSPRSLGVARQAPATPPTNASTQPQPQQQPQQQQQQQQQQQAAERERQPDLFAQWKD